MRSLNLGFFLGILFCAAVFSGCSSSSSEVQTQNSTINVVTTDSSVYLADFPDVGDIPRAASESNTATGSAFIAANGTKISNTSAVMDLTYIPTEESESIPEFCYAIYRFSKLDDDVIGLKIHMNSHNISPAWIAFANEKTGRWEYPVESELSSVEIWKTIDNFDFAKYKNSDDEITLAVILADDQESITIYDLEFITASEVKSFTASYNLDNGVKLNWKAGNSCYGFMIYRRLIDSDDEWDQIIDKPLSRYETSFFDETAEQGKEYVYRINCAYGPYSNEDHWIWSEGMLVAGRRLIFTSPLEVSEGSVLQIEPVNWYNQLGFIGVDKTNNTMIAYQSESFLPDAKWHWHNAGSGIAGKVVSWQENLTQPYTIYPSSQQDNLVMTCCYSENNNVYSLVGWIDTAGEISWLDPVLVREGSYQVIHCFKMSRRIGLILWNIDEQLLEVSDSMDMYGRLWFDIEEWPWEWRSMEAEPPHGPVCSEYSMAGELVCYMGETSGTTKVYTIVNGDWGDYSPNIPCAPGPLYVELVTDAIVPSSGVIYLTPERDSIHIVRRQFVDEWGVIPEVVVYTSDGSNEISEFAEYCPASYSGLNYIAWIEGGNVNCITNNYWSLEYWFNPVVLDDSGTCSNLDIIRIGSDDNYSYAVYATFLSEDAEGNTQFNFRLLDNRFIPAL